MAAPANRSNLFPSLSLFSLRGLFKNEELHRIDDKRVRLQKIPSERIRDIAVMILLGFLAASFVGFTLGGGFSFFYLNAPTSWTLSVRIGAFCVFSGVSIALTVVFIVVTKIKRKNIENLNQEEENLANQLYKPMGKEEVFTLGAYLDPKKLPDDLKKSFPIDLQTQWEKDSELTSKRY